MAQNSRIEWTHHTFNPWWGCCKVDCACARCYAERFACERLQLPIWGPTAERRFFGAAHWLEPLEWNRKAERAHERHHVFCASMADVFEGRRDLDPYRERLWNLIDVTPSLVWLLLTKRPQNILRMVPAKWLKHPRDNVWVGTSCGQQKAAKELLPHLRRVPAKVRFLSVEPLLEAVQLDLAGVDWVIVGGESGPGARPMKAEWVRDIREQCQAAGVPFFFKQWGGVNKKKAGRLLDGRTYDEMPCGAHPAWTSVEAVEEPLELATAGSLCSLPVFS